MKKNKSFLVTILMALNVSPKIIVTALLSGLAFADFLVRAKSMAKALVNFGPTLFPDLDPPPGDFDDEVTTLDKLETIEKNLIQQLKSNTAAKIKQKKVVEGIAVDKYSKQIQTTSGVTVDNIKKVGFGVKGVDDLKAEATVSCSNSHPVISDFEYGYLTHTFHVRNSITGKIGLPPDSYYIEVYEQIGGDEPKDYHKMTSVGRVVRGKFTNHFLTEQQGSYVWYMFVYVPKSATAEPELSGAIKRNIV